VVLVVWDVDLRDGRWAILQDVIKDFDKHNPNWRTQKNKTIHIPWQNTTDDQGLVSLRQAVGRRLYPIIAKGRIPEIRLKASFPDSSEGRPVRDEFVRFSEEGAPFILDGKYLDELTFSNRWMEWFGGFDLNSVRLSFKSTPSLETLTLMYMLLVLTERWLLYQTLN
jgi:hypothetical protein